VDVPALGQVKVGRCPHCGTRATRGAAPTRVLSTCESCALPFLADPGGDSDRCPDCRAGRTDLSRPERGLAEATESEIRAALDAAWTFVSQKGLAEYLARVAREVASGLGGVSSSPRVVLLDERSSRILALPSGTLVMSLGMLRFLEDEAELAFVLARELAHVASGQAAERLVRSSFGLLARADGGGPEAWTGAVVTLARLGYGRRGEAEADSRALRTLLALGYDPNAAVRYLRRLERDLGTGDPALAELAVALPPPGYRIRKLERVLYGRVARAPLQRVNRDAFRRATAPASRPEALVAVRLGPEDERPAVEPARRRGLRRFGLAAAGIAAVALLLLLATLLLRG
jgi:predicted Zn-dependent protease